VGAESLALHCREQAFASIGIVNDHRNVAIEFGCIGAVGRLAGGRRPVKADNRSPNAKRATVIEGSFEGGVETRSAELSVLVGLPAYGADAKSVVLEGDELHAGEIKREGADRDVEGHVARDRGLRLLRLGSGVEEHQSCSRSQATRKAVSDCRCS
jgi:hypothetical protein